MKNDILAIVLFTSLLIFGGACESPKSTKDAAIGRAKKATPLEALQGAVWTDVDREETLGVAIWSCPEGYTYLITMRRDGSEVDRIQLSGPAEQLDVRWHGSALYVEVAGSRYEVQSTGLVSA